MKNVVILPKYRFAMFCIPKAANSSIKAAILNAIGFETGEEIDHHHPALHISTAQTVYNCCDGFFRATVVRNPFDRLVSCYESKVKDPYKCSAHGFAMWGFDSDMDFAEFIELVCKNPFANIHFQPQLPALKCCEKLLVDYIGFFEKLSESWENIRKAVKFKMGKLKHFNKTPERKPYREYYDGKTKRRVSKVFKCDLDFFGYKF